MNHLVVCGLNYHSTPLAIRERFTIPESCIAHALQALSRLPHIREAAVLSTCNRTEVYAAVDNVSGGLHSLDSFFMATQSIADHQALKPNFKLLREDAALHLFRVASGLDSMVLGEGQIMSQVKAAHQAALEANTAGTLLDQVFKMALGCGKRVRSETSMARRAVSVSSAALELARSLRGPLKDRSTLVIGAGKMAQICLKHLLGEAGSGPILLVNRSRERVEKFLENDLQNRDRLSTGMDFEDRHILATGVDLVIVSTSAPTYLLEYEKIVEQSVSREVIVIDISVPRNVDPAIATIPGIILLNADDLACVVNKNLAEREMLVGEAETIIFQALESFHTWQRSLLVAPTITGLRQKIEAIRVEQMQKSQNSSPSLGHSESQQQVEEISRAIVNQILHHPTVQLKSTRDYEILRQQAEALRLLFNLDVPGGPVKGKARTKGPHHEAESEACLSARSQASVLECQPQAEDYACESPSTVGAQGTIADPMEASASELEPIGTATSGCQHSGAESKTATILPPLVRSL